MIIAYTPVVPSDGQFMETANDWSNPVHSFTFWTLSRGLYNRVFNNLGFDVQFRKAKARFQGHEHARETIVAVRRK